MVDELCCDSEDAWLASELKDNEARDGVDGESPPQSNFEQSSS